VEQTVNRVFEVCDMNHDGHIQKVSVSVFPKPTHLSRSQGQTAPVVCIPASCMHAYLRTYLHAIHRAHPLAPALSLPFFLPLDHLPCWQHEMLKALVVIQNQGDIENTQKEERSLLVIKMYVKLKDPLRLEVRVPKVRALGKCFIHDCTCSDLAFSQKGSSSSVLRNQEFPAKKS